MKSKNNILIPWDVILILFYKLLELLLKIKLWIFKMLLFVPDAFCWSFLPPMYLLLCLFSMFLESLSLENTEWVRYPLYWSVNFWMALCKFSQTTFWISFFITLANFVSSTYFMFTIYLAVSFSAYLYMKSPFPKCCLPHCPYSLALENSYFLSIEVKCYIFIEAFLMKW